VLDKVSQILLVEDNDADVYLFRKALETAELQFELTVMRDGAEALAFVRREGKYAASPVPNLVVLDLNLPKDGGIQVLEAIREREPFSNVPVAIVSSSDSPQDRDETGKFGVDRYITKPPDLDEFLAIGQIFRELLSTGSTAVTRK
jgi:chemotaxis family two-component system response regulator Rcp1